MPDKGNHKTNTSTSGRLYRSEKNKVVGGVSTGLGDYFRIDPTLIRILFLILTLFGGSGIVLYLILWAMLPSEKNLNKNSSQAIKDNLENMKQSAKYASDRMHLQGENNRQPVFAIILVVLGILFLLNNFNIFRLDIGRLWPLLLIILGVLILRRR